MEDSTQALDDLSKVFEAMDNILEQIDAKEAEVLNRVFLRFCVLFGKEIDFKQVRRVKDPQNANQWAYYYKYGVKFEEYFLMSRVLVVDVVDGKPDYKLNVKFNPELLRDDE